MGNIRRGASTLRVTSRRSRYTRLGTSNGGRGAGGSHDDGRSRSMPRHGDCKGSEEEEDSNEGSDETREHIE